MADHARVKKIDRLRFEGLTYAHETHDPTMKNVDFQFPAERIIWVKSPEGAGKSTLLQLLAGLLVPQSGGYYINDENVTEMSFEEFLPYRLNIGYTFDYGGLISNRTLQDNLLLPLLYHNLIPVAEAKTRVEEMLKLFEVSKFRNERPAHVPGRVRKLACLLRSLVTHPQLLLMDDPSVGLGAETSDHLSEVIVGLRELGHLKHIFISSYDDKFMNQFKYDVIHLDEGQLYFQEEESKKVASL